MASPNSVLAQVEELEQQMLDLNSKLSDEQQTRMQHYREQIKPFMERRDLLIAGKVTPTPEELTEFKPAGDSKSVKVGAPVVGADEEQEESEPAPAIPFFWLSAMVNTAGVGEHITARDKRALEYLNSVLVVVDNQGLRAEFHFRDNPYFYNKVLRRGLFVLHDGLADEHGEPVTTEQSTQIEWKEGMNLAMKEVTRSRGKGKKGKRGGGELQFVQTLRPCPSFFNFFGPIGRPAKADIDPTMEDEEDVDESELLEQQQRKQVLDGEILSAVVSKLVPTAVTRYLDSPIYSLPPPRDNEDEDNIPDDEDDYEIINATPTGPESLPLAAQQAIHAVTKAQAAMDRVLDGCKAEEREMLWSSYLLFRDLCDQRRALLVAGGKGVAAARNTAGQKRQNKGEENEEDAQIEEAEEEDEEEEEEEHLSISKFWLLALMSVPRASEVIQKRDERILAYLADVRFIKPKPPSFQAEPPSTAATGTLELEFLPNPFFNQRVLRKTYYLDDGSEVKLANTEPVVWNEGCDPTVRVGRDGKSRPHRSFFCLFKAQGELRLFGVEGNSQEALAEARELEGELLQAFRQELIPFAAERYGNTIEQYGSDGGLDESNDEDEEDQSEDDEEEEEGEESEEKSEARKAARAARAAQKKKGDAGGFKMTKGWWLLLLLVLFIVADVFIFFDAITGSKPNRR